MQNAHVLNLIWPKLPPSERRTICILFSCLYSLALYVFRVHVMSCLYNLALCVLLLLLYMSCLYSFALYVLFCLVFILALSAFCCLYYVVLSSFFCLVFILLSCRYSLALSIFSCLLRLICLVWLVFKFKPIYRRLKGIKIPASTSLSANNAQEGIITWRWHS